MEYLKKPWNEGKTAFLLLLIITFSCGETEIIVKSNGDATPKESTLKDTDKVKKSDCLDLDWVCKVRNESDYRTIMEDAFYEIADSQLEWNIPFRGDYSGLLKRYIASSIILCAEYADKELEAKCISRKVEELKKRLYGLDMKESTRLIRGLWLKNDTFLLRDVCAQVALVKMKSLDNPFSCGQICGVFPKRIIEIESFVDDNLDLYTITEQTEIAYYLQEAKFDVEIMKNRECSGETYISQRLKELIGEELQVQYKEKGCTFKVIEFQGIK